MKDMSALCCRQLASLVFTFIAAGCAHSVEITSTPPGAEILINGESVGKAPVTYKESSGGEPTVEVTGRLDGKETKVTIERKGTSMGAVGAGAGIGAGGCCVLGGASAVGAFGGGVILLPLSLLFPPVMVLPALCWLGCLPALLAIPAGAGIGYAFFGATMPDQVQVDMKNAKPIPSTPTPPKTAMRF